MILQVLFPYIVAFYLLDCVALLGAAQVLYLSQTGESYSRRGGGIRLFGLLPWSRGYVVEDDLWGFAPDGLHRVRKGPELDDEGAPGPIPYKDLAKIRVDGKSLHFAHGGRLDASCPSAARELARFLEKLVKAAPKRREKLIRKWSARRLDAAAAGARLKAHPTLFFAIRLYAGFLFFCAFALLPVSLFTEYRVWLPLGFLLPLMGALYLTILVLSVILHRKIHPEDISGRVMLALGMVLCPPIVMHAASALTRDQLFGLDPLAAAARLTPGKPFLALARKELYKAGQMLDEPENKGLAFYWETRKKQVEALLKSEKIQPEELTPKPENQDQGAASWCPVCRAQYLPGPGHCPDCGVKLRPF